MNSGVSLVRSTCSHVASNSRTVTINNDEIDHLALTFSEDLSKKSFRLGPSQWACPYHLSYEECKDLDLAESGLTPEDAAVHFCLVVDTINFCFWPLKNLEYEHMAGGIKRAFLSSPTNLSMKTLSSLTSETLSKWIGYQVPNMEERIRFIHEISNYLLTHHNGSGANFVRKANHSATTLVDNLTSAFPNFRDHSVYDGKQVFFYKRAQIFVGDIWGCFEGKGIGEFTDITELTMFADYRVPQVLEAIGVLVYSQNLKKKISDQVEIQPGSEEETEIRACTVVAVERIRETVQRLLSKEKKEVFNLTSIEVDWYLWNYGEARLSSLPTHHRTLTVYY